MAIVYVIWGIFVAIVVYVIVRRVRGQKKAFADALVETCFICDSARLDVRTDETDYVCSSCGHDTRAMSRVKPDLEEQFRDVKNALSYLKQGLKDVQEAEKVSSLETLGGVGARKYDHLEDAQNQLMSGLRLLKDRVGANPELLEAPDVAGQFGAATKTMDLYFDNLLTDLLVRSKVKRTRQQIEDFIPKVEAIKDHLGRLIIDQQKRAQTEA